MRDRIFKDARNRVRADRGKPEQEKEKNVTEAKHEMKIGDLDDGGIYVGLSAENGKPLHAGLKDLPDYKTYEEALGAAEQLKPRAPLSNILGCFHRRPTPEEYGCIAGCRLSLRFLQPCP